MPGTIAGGRKILFPPEEGARNDFIAIFVEDCYRLLALESSPGKILDIGANLGFFSIAARVAFPQAIIHAYEPVESLSQFLRPNSEEFGFEVFYEAVGGHAGYVDLDLRGDTNQTRVLESGSASIPKISIDAAIERLGGAVDLLKIDCEGSEWEMFKEGRLWNQVGRMAMEYHNFDGQPHSQIVRELERIGFEIEAQVYDPSDNFGLVFAINGAAKHA